MALLRMTVILGSAACITSGRLSSHQRPTRVLTTKLDAAVFDSLYQTLFQTMNKNFFW